MRIAQIVDGSVVGILNFPDSMKLAENGRSVSGTTEVAVVDLDNPEDKEAEEYKCRYDAPKGFTLALASEEVETGWTYTKGGKFQAPPEEEEFTPAVDPIALLTPEERKAFNTAVLEIMAERGDINKKRLAELKGV